MLRNSSLNEALSFLLEGRARRRSLIKADVWLSLREGGNQSFDHTRKLEAAKKYGCGGSYVFTESRTARYTTKSLLVSVKYASVFYPSAFGEDSESRYNDH